MALYFKDTEITNIDNLVPQTSLDITDMWFGSTNVYTVWDTYEGTLPATLNANGANMFQYQIYGNTGGVGDVTESGEPNGYKIPLKNNNFYEHWSTNVLVGYWESAAMNRVVYGTGTYVSVKVSTNRTGYFKFTFEKPINIARLILDGVYTTNSQTPIADNVSEFIVSKQTEQDFGISWRDTTSATAMWDFSEVKCIGDFITTPIYIGDTALQKDEYIDYAEQKVYRISEELWDANGTTTNQNGDIRSGNEFSAGNTYGVTNANVVSGMVFYRLGVASTSATHIPPGAKLNIEATNTLIIWCASATYMPNISVKRINIPTDPPVPLPALPTCDGTTTVDFAGESQAVPEKVLLRYRKEGF